MLLHDEKRRLGELKTAEIIGLEKGRQEGREEGRQEGLEHGRQEGREEGKEEGREEIIRCMYASGISVEEICRIVNLSIEDVRRIL